MKKLIITSAIISSSAFSFAQQIPMSSQYYTNMFVNNPAFTGTKEYANAFISHRSQWTGVAGAPQTSYLTLDGPIQAKNIGLGLKVYNDVTDIVNRIGASVNYSYKLKINDDNNLFIGLAVGIINNRIDFSKAVVRDTDDPFLLTGTQSKTVFSPDFGLGYTWKKLELGFAMPQVIGNSIKYKTNDGSNSYYHLSRNYLGSVKYVFDVVKEKEITAYPLIMVKGAQGTPFQYDVNAVLDWKKYGWIGITYHSNYAIAASLGVRYKSLAIGYSYDIGIGAVKSYPGGASEFLLSYTFGNNKPEEAPVAAVAQPADDSMTYEMLSALKTKSDTSEAQLNRLKAELEKLKSEKGGNRENLTENLMRVASRNDYIDESGAQIGPGFYLIVGAYSSKANAEKLKGANLIKGYTNTMIIQSQTTKNFLVVVSKAEKKEDAVYEINKYKAEYPDAWLLHLE